MGIKIGFVGCGQFGGRFLELYKNHPLVDELILADSAPENLEKAAKLHDIKRTCNSLDEILKTDVDAVCIFTQRQLHGPMVISALKAGKHVCCAVPMATDIDEIKEIIELVEKTKLIYMTNETSYYYPNAIFCREQYKKGAFGKFTYADAHYEHDMAHFYEPYRRSGGKNWKRIAGFPPMYYPTHSISMVLSTTGAHVETVSCLGFRDEHEDGIFGEEKNDFQNLFSNESALMRTSDGGCCRINEMRRVVVNNGENMVAMSFKGTDGVYTTGVESYFTKRDGETQKVSELITCSADFKKTAEDSSDFGNDEVLNADFFTGTSPIHHVERLPKEFLNSPNGHDGSHQFLVDDFCRAVTENKLPPNHAWAAAKYCAPGLIAHKSAIQNGKMLEVPYFGEAPDYWKKLPLDED